MAKDKQFYIIIFVIFLIDIASSLYISQKSKAATEDESFMVICRDEGGKSVKWKGPKGIITKNSHPQFQEGSYGQAIFFSKARLEDTGTYYCISPKESEVFSLTVEAIIHPTTTERVNIIKNSPNDNEDYYETYDDSSETQESNEQNNKINNTPTEGEKEPITTETQTEINTERNLQREFSTAKDNYNTLDINDDDSSETKESDGQNNKINSTPTEGEKESITFETQTEINTERTLQRELSTTKDPQTFPSTPSTRKHSPKDKLEIVDTPEIQTGAEGKPFTLKCKANMKNTIITWQSDNTGQKYNVTNEGLVFTNLSREDAGLYQCLAVQFGKGNTKGQNITLNVHHIPTLPYNVFAEEEEVYAFLNEILNLTCEVEANPPPTFEWRNAEMGKIINESDFKSILMLNVTEDTPGTYQCTARNSMGELNKYFDVQLGEQPESPTNIELIKSTADSLLIKLEVPDISPEIRDPVMDPQWIVVEYKPLEKDEWHAIEIEYSNEPITLLNLSKKTKYQLRAATKNIAGFSEYFFNDTMTFETSTAASVHTTSPIIVIYLSVLLVSMFWIA